MIINGNLQFHTLGGGELQNAIMERMSTTTRDALTGGDLVAGRLIYNTTLNAVDFYSGSGWSTLSASGDVTNLQTEVNSMQTASGGIFDTDGTYDATVLDALGNVTSSTDLANALSQLDSAISTAAGVDTLPELSDVNSAASSGALTNQVLTWTGSEWNSETVASVAGATKVFYNAVKSTAGTIAAGIPVYIVGHNGTNITVEPANSNSSATMASAGIASESITDSVAGEVVLNGEISGLDTSSFGVGAELFVGGGVLTSTAPTSEANLIQKVAEVTKSDVSTGTIAVLGAGRINSTSNLDENNMFIGNASNQAITQAHTVGNVSDVTLTSIAVNDLLQWNGSAWVNILPSAIGGDSFGTINGDSGSTVADNTSDTVGLIGATNGGIVTVAEDVGDTVTFAMDVADLADGSASTLVLADEIAVNDAGTTQKFSFTDMVEDLDIPNNIVANGLITRTSDNNYISRGIGISVVANHEGLSLVNGNAVAGNPTIGLGFNTLPSEAGTPSGGDVLVMNDGVNNVKVSVTQLTAGIVGSGIDLADLNDVDDITAHTAGTGYILVGDGTNLDVTEVTAAAPANFIEAIQDMIDAFVVGGTNLTSVYDDGGGTLTLNVDDAFLSNIGDNLTAGTLTIDAAASLVVATGSTFTITDAPTVGTDGANKDYVDSVASGLDIKDSVRVATAAALPAYTQLGSGVGATLTADAVGILTVDGVATVLGDRILVKTEGASHADHGIYEVTTEGTAGVAFVLTRATDSDGSPSNEVTPGNHTFAEEGTVNADTGWVISTNGTITVDTTAVTWTQFTGAGSFTAQEGVAQSGSTIFMQVDSLTALGVAPASTDLMVFADLSEVSTTGSNDRTRTIAEFVADFDLLTGDAGLNAITGSDGVLISGQDVQLDIVGLSSIATLGADEMVFEDNSASGTHIKRSITAFLSDHNIATTSGGGSLTASNGVELTSNDFAVSIDGLIGGTAAIVGADLLIFDDGAAGTNNARTFTNMMADLDIVNLGAFSSAHLVSRTADDTYAEVTLAVSGAGNEDGLVLTNGALAAGAITFGLDISGNVTSGTAESTSITHPLGSTFTSSGAADYYTINTPTVGYYVWFDVSNGNSDPVPTGLTGIEVDVTAADSATVVAIAAAAAIDAIAGFSVPVPGSAVAVVTNVAPGAAADAADGVSSGAGFVVDTQGVDAAIANDDMLMIWDRSADSNLTVTVNELADAVSGVTSTSELTDVTTAASASGHMLVADGSNDYVPSHISNVHTQSSSSTTWTVTHSLNQQFVNVTVYDSSNAVIIPQSITATDANTTTITFNSAITGTAVIMGVTGSKTTSA